MAYSIPIPSHSYISPFPFPIPWCLRFNSRSRYRNLFPFFPIPVWLMNDIIAEYSSDDKCSKCKHATVLASKSRLVSRDLTSFFVFSTRSGTCEDNEYDLAAHGGHQTAKSCTEVHQCESTDGNFGTREKVAVPIPTFTFPHHIPIFGIFVLPFPCEWESHSNAHL